MSRIVDAYEVTKSRGHGWEAIDPYVTLDVAFKIAEELREKADNLRFVELLYKTQHKDGGETGLCVISETWRTPTMPAPAFRYYVAYVVNYSDMRKEW